MRPFTYTTKFTLAAVMLLSFIVSLWMVSAAAAVSPSTYVAVAALLVGIGTVTLMTWRSAQPTGSIGQVLHATETTQSSNAARRE